MRKLHFVLVAFIPFLAGCKVQSIAASSDILKEKMKDVRNQTNPDMLPGKKEHTLMAGYIKG